MFKSYLIFNYICIICHFVLIGNNVYSQEKKPPKESPSGEPKLVEPIIRSSDITKDGLDINQIIDNIISKRLAKIPDNTKEPPLIIWLIDNNSYLKQQKCNNAFAQAIVNALKQYNSCQIAIVKFSQKSEVILNPTNRTQSVLQAINDIFKKPDDNYKNYCAAIRFCITSFKDYPGKKHLVIFTLENNTVESQLEETLTALKDNKITLDVISNGTTLQDAEDFHKSFQSEQSISRLESAMPELGALHDGKEDDPKDWRFCHFEAFLGCYNRNVPSGYGYYGLSRLVAYSDSDGKYYLYYPDVKTQSFCGLHHCKWCVQPEHSKYHNCSTDYSKLSSALAPVLISRKYYEDMYRDDPMYKFLQDVNANYKATKLPFDPKTIFADGKRVLPAVIKQIEDEINKYAKGIKDIEERLTPQYEGKCNPRFKAHMMVILAAFYVEHFNLCQYKHYLEQLKRPPYNIEDSYISIEEECLCHLEEWMEMSYKNNLHQDVNKAIKIMFKFNEIKLYGGKEEEERLAQVLGKVAQVIMEYKNTPWELVARRIPLVSKFNIERIRPIRPPSNTPRPAPPGPNPTPVPTPVPTPAHGTPTPTPR